MRSRVTGFLMLLSAGLMVGPLVAAPSPSASPVASPAVSPSPPVSASPNASPDPSSTPTPDPTATAKTESADFVRACSNNFHLPLSRKMTFSLDGSRAYAMLPVVKAPDAENPLPKGTIPERKLVYFEIQLQNGTSVPGFGLRNTLAADLVMTFDNRGFATSMAAAIMEPAFSNCARGDLELVSGFAGTKGPVRRKGFLGVVPSFRVPVLYDPMTRNLLQLDTDTMQSRFLAKVPPDLHAVHADPLGGKLIFWDNGRRTLSLAAVKESASKPVRARSIKFKNDYQVLQSGNRFAAIKVDPSDNSFTIHEIPVWTGVTREGEYKFKLPATNTVSQAQIWPNFDRKIALVAGRTDDVRRRWQKVFLVDYGKGRILREFKAQGTDYFGEGGISPNTKTIALINMSGNQSVADKVMVFDLSKKTNREIKLAAP